MSNQTLKRPTAKRRTRANAARTGSYRKQTARVEGFRDGKPLIQLGSFAWGGNLTRLQKQRIQRRAAYAFFAAVMALILIVVAFGIVQQNLIIPNQSIASVNGANISQDTYRKLLAYNSQDLWNKVQSELKQQASLQTRATNGDTNASTQLSIVTSQITSDEANYTQSQLTQTTMDQLVENQLILQGDRAFEQQNPALKSKLEPSASAIDSGVKAFKNAFPPNEAYQDFLSKDNLSADDVRSAVTLQIRRTLMQNYLASQLVSPTRQVHLRRIELSTAADAANVLKQIKATPNDATLWSSLAKQKSLDANSKNVGGDMGWVPPATGDAAIENWAYAAGRKVNDLSPVIKDSSGTFDVVQIVGIDPSRVFDATLLSDAKSNALSHWLTGRKADPANHFTTPDPNMMSASRNLPVLPDLNAQLPAQTPPAGALPPQG
jgi:hypothetical protein